MWLYRTLRHIHLNARMSIRGNGGGMTKMKSQGTSIRIPDDLMDELQRFSAQIVPPPGRLPLSSLLRIIVKAYGDQQAKPKRKAA